VAARPREIRIFETEAGRRPFADWIETLDEEEIYGVVLGRIERVEDGNFGDCKSVGEGVFELRIDCGPGYRVYFGQDGDFVILLWGGAKRTQRKDLMIAKRYWKEYNA
jgi:putative addiction module killer protein